MQFKEHYRVKGTHSYLSASKYHWIRYDDEKLESTFLKAVAAQRGTELHALAAEAIRLRVPFQGNDTLAAYVNDSIGHRMNPEQVLYYSDNCYGTADSISYRNGVLRVYDLKTGETPGNMDQLMVYTAIFCLEYKIKPSDLEVILRIYQSDEIVEYVPRYDEIIPIMQKIIHFDNRINELKAEVLSHGGV